eukprot:4662853-Karenia_brevis.AAC.1
MHEFQCPMWLCAIDFKKAFDTVEHDAIWRARVSHGVSSTGTKQGDPISPSLFNSVLEFALCNVMVKWCTKRW